MPVSGLVVTLDDEAAVRSLADVLERDPRWTLGELQGNRLPLVCATLSVQEHELALEQLEELAGVVLVELAFNDISDVDELLQLPRRHRRSRTGHQGV